MLALLVYLAVESHTLHRRDALATLLWPDQPREKARHSLRQALTTLRRDIDDASANPPFVLTEGDGVGFNLTSDLRLDIIEFNTLLDTCAEHAHRRAETCVPCARRLEQALRLYRGEFCAGASLGESSEIDDWFHLQRERLHRRAMTAFTALAAFHDHNGRPIEARAILERQLELDPWRESAHRELMRLMYRTGDRAGALLQYEKCARMLDEELGLEPEPATTELFEQIRAGPPIDQGIVAQRAAPPSTTDMSEPLTPLVGRDQEVEQLTDLLSLAECRLLTLVGQGGIGKTRLALHVAKELAESFAHGASFVPLGSVRSVDLLAPTIADLLGLAHPGRGDPTQHLVNQLRDRELLLILDGMEHLLEGSAFITTMLARAPDLKMLITSRERLGLQPEWVFPVGGLAVPPEDDTQASDAYGSVRLFTECVRRVRPLQPVRAEELPTIGHICRLVEGMPLAIELAAAWSSTLSIDNIAREIGESIDFLAIPLRDLPARHRSMRAVFDQSWELLSPEEQGVFQRSSAFRAGFSREAAEYVAGATLPILSSLVSKSFLRVDTAGRYSIHELLRQYGENRLASAHRDELRTRDRYGKYFLSFVAEREEALTGRHQKEALAEILSEIANIRHAWHVALQMSMKEPINQAMHGLWLFYTLRGWMREGEATFGEAVSVLSPAEDESDGKGLPDMVLAKALTRQGGFHSGLGHYETASRLLQEGIIMLRHLDARNELALALNFMATTMHMAGTQEEEQALLEESLALFQEVSDPWGEAYVLNDVARLMHARGDGARADELVLESQRLFRHVNDVRGLAFAAQNLGILAADRDDIEAARQFHEQALALRRESEDQWGIASSLVHLGIVTRCAGDLDTAQTLLMEALHVAREAWVLPVVLEGFVELAAVLAAKGHGIQAGEMLATILHDSAASHQIRERSEELLVKLEHDLSDFDRIELHERAASTTVDMLAKSLLS